MSIENKNDAVVEPNPHGNKDDVILRSLHLRIRQQEILAELGVLALHGVDFTELLSQTVRLTAEGLRAEFCKVLEYHPAENNLLVKAGIGWNPGVVGIAVVGADLASPAGFALHTGKPVISNHLENEERFRTPKVLAEHHIKRAMNVILQGDGKPYGVLEVDSQSEDQFVEHDLAFLQGAANMLGMAIERERRERHLKAAVDRQDLLMKEMNHRVKNSLAIVASMLHLQARNTDSEEMSGKFEEASRRVSAVARAHERLYRTDDLEATDLGIYFEDVCSDLKTSMPHCELIIESQKNIIFPIDKSISLALIVVELVTNAAKYAYPDQSNGKIWVTLHADDSSIRLTVRDEGKGLPPDFESSKARGLGMRIVTAFTTQLNSEIQFKRNPPGTEVIVEIPI